MGRGKSNRGQEGANPIVYAVHKHLLLLAWRHQPFANFWASFPFMVGFDNNNEVHQKNSENGQEKFTISGA